MVTCTVCGQQKPMERMIRRKLNGRQHFCCGIRCEVKWEKHNLMGTCG